MSELNDEEMMRQQHIGDTIWGFVFGSVFEREHKRLREYMTGWSSIAVATAATHEALTAADAAVTAFRKTKVLP